MKQIFPSSITGKGAVGTGSPPSVLEHAFGKGDPYTLGVEEEYMLLDPETWDLVQHIDSVLSAAADGEHEARINAELMQSVLEVTTPVCRTAADVLGALSQLRAYVVDIARDQGCRLGSAGTHPFSLFERQRITARDRYRQLVDQLQYVARRELIFGMHMHVAVDDPEKAIQVMNGLLVHLPQMLALSASSPFWRGEPTGLSSSRQMVFAAFPRSGPPPRFRDYDDYAALVGQLERTGCIADYTHIWWDIRPHPRLGTIEMRVCDAVTRLDDVIAITAYYQAIVKMYCEQHDAGKEIPSWHRMLTTENKWLAARYGLEAPVMDLATGRRNRVPVAQLIRRTLRDVEPHARELGSDRELDGIREILARGNGADRQLRVWNANRDIVEVVREIAAATEASAVHA
ncbi:MAG TPA: carboxylate-amine ligase [Gaiellaceae bacterium]|nr:carboxylate-amine ligase [Gaiellaceae bacterium]